jgi:hypothetical protein
LAAGGGPDELAAVAEPDVPALRAVGDSEDGEGAPTGGRPTGGGTPPDGGTGGVTDPEPGVEIVTGGVETGPTVMLGADTVTAGISPVVVWATVVLGRGSVGTPKPAVWAGASPTADPPPDSAAARRARRMRRGLTLATPFLSRARDHPEDIVRCIVEDVG